MIGLGLALGFGAVVEARLGLRGQVPQRAAVGTWLGLGLGLGLGRG